MSKSTHFTHSTSHQGARVGGVPVSYKGAQDLAPVLVPNNWFPVNLPSASNGTPSQADCLKLLNTLAPLVARLTVQQSVALALAYRTVQSGIALGGNMTVNGVSGASSTFFDSGASLGETVPVDVVNKNPALGYDLALRLAKLAAMFLDGQLFGLYSQATGASVGAQGVTPTAANLATAVGELPVNGEPVFALFESTVYQSMLAAGNLANGVQQGQLNGFDPLYGLTANRPYRVLASDKVTYTGSTARNLMITPSFWSLATADLGTNIAAGAVGALTGITQMVTSIYRDPEMGTPQLALQLLISNTGAGTQKVYVNAQFAALAINPANAVPILA